MEIMIRLDSYEDVAKFKKVIDSISQITEDKPAKKAEPKEKEQAQLAPRRKYTIEQQADINAIKEAHRQIREQKNAEKTRKKLDIDDNIIVQRIDRNGEKPGKLAEEYGCAYQTIMNRYKKAKEAQR